jgi:hypothetical protein
MSIYACFMPKNRPNSKKATKCVSFITAAAFSPISRRGVGVAVGGGRLSKSFEKFHIASQEAELQLPKLRLKTQNHTLLNRS